MTDIVQAFITEQPPTQGEGWSGHKRLLHRLVSIAARDRTLVVEASPQGYMAYEMHMGSKYHASGPYLTDQGAMEALALAVIETGLDSLATYEAEDYDRQQG